jgi:hypothetical protein
LLELTSVAQNYNLNLDNQEMSDGSVMVEKSKDLATVHSGAISLNSGDLDLKRPTNHMSRESLGLLLSCQLAEFHKGQISIQGSIESGYRYVLSLPIQATTTETEATT